MATNNLDANIDDGRSPNTGIYRGRVEDNKDPKKLGRVRVRVPQSHGVPSSDNKLSSQNKDKLSVKNISTSDTNSESNLEGSSSSQEDDLIPTPGLPWAFPITATGTGHDHGSVMVPDIGDYVFVIYENGDKNSPLYLGGCYGIPTSQKTIGTLDPSNATNRYKVSPAGANECPQEVYDYNGDPTTKIIYKSRKGFTIAVRETDDNETFFIQTDDQQAIMIRNPRNDKYNSVELRGKKGQSVQLVSANGKDEVVLMSPSQKVRMNLDDNKVHLTVNDTVVIDLENGEARLTSKSTTISSDQVTINASNVNINSKVNINGHLEASSIHSGGSIIADGSNSNHHSH